MLDKTNLFGKTLCQGKKYYDTGGFFCGLFLAPEIKYSLIFNEVGNIEQHMTFRGFNDNKRLLDQSQYFNTLDGKKMSAMLPKSCYQNLKMVFLYFENQTM